MIFTDVFGQGFPSFGSVSTNITIKNHTGDMIGLNVLLYCSLDSFLSTHFANSRLPIAVSPPLAWFRVLLTLLHQGHHLQMNLYEKGHHLQMNLHEQNTFNGI